MDPRRLRHLAFPSTMKPKRPRRLPPIITDIDPDLGPVNTDWYGVDGKHTDPAPSAGIWWCNSHGREAPYVNAKGEHTCPPHSGGIMIPCFTVFAPMTVTYTKPRKRRRHT